MLLKHILAAITLGLCIFIAISCQISSKDYSPKFSIMQGPADEHSTVINVLIKKNVEYEYKVLDRRLNEIKSSIKKMTIQERDWSDWKIINIYLSNLELDKKYFFEVSAIEKGVTQYDRREFSLLNHKNESGVKIMAGSCMSDHYLEGSKNIWPVIYDKRPDAMLLMGDMVYADVINGVLMNEPSSKRQLWDRYVETRQRIHLYSNPNLIPVYAIWDDHDYGVNNGNKDYAFKNESKKILRDFFPVLESTIQGPGISLAVSFGRHHFYLLDVRSFRSKNVHLGSEQMGWLRLLLGKNEGTHWLVEGDQFFGQYHEHESYGGEHKNEFEQFLKMLKAFGKKYYFLSGDRHFYELMRIPKHHVGHETYEITTSAIHAIVFPKALESAPNPLRIDGVDETFNFGLIKLNDEKVELEIYDDKGKQLAKKDLTLSK